MNYLTGVFYLFLVVTLLAYYVIPKRFRYIVLFFASMFFYGFGNPKHVLVLLGVAVLTYLGGIAIEDSKGKKPVYILFFFATLGCLCLFKYTSLPLLVGVSFYIFQATNYLGDVYRGNIKAERNFVLYGAFVAFFPTLLSGPIQKSRELIPQLKNPNDFDSDRIMKGILLLGWGICEKLLVANNLRVITEGVYTNYEIVSWAHFVLAACCYSLYIYADFCSYSDMARGVAKLFGIEVGRNFKNPYLSTTLSEFWRRWHVSLNDWFVENIYIPLGGSRKGKLRKYFNMMLIFVISGLWHGNGYNFLAWGIANGILVLVGLWLMPLRKKAIDKLGIGETDPVFVFVRRVLVFIFISGTWIFFANGTKPALYIIKSILKVDLSSIKNPGLLEVAGTRDEFFTIVALTLVFVVVQILRDKEALWYKRFMASPAIVQCFAGAILMLAVFFGACTYIADVSANTAGAQFIYFDF